VPTCVKLCAVVQYFLIHVYWLLHLVLLRVTQSIISSSTVIMCSYLHTSIYIFWSQNSTVQFMGNDGRQARDLDTKPENSHIQLLEFKLTLVRITQTGTYMISQLQNSTPTYKQNSPTILYLCIPNCKGYSNCWWLWKWLFKKSMTVNYVSI
jgi:hypothetical protein